MMTKDNNMLLMYVLTLFGILDYVDCDERICSDLVMHSELTTSCKKTGKTCDPKLSYINDENQDCWFPQKGINESSWLQVEFNGTYEINHVDIRAYNSSKGKRLDCIPTEKSCRKSNLKFFLKNKVVDKIEINVDIHCYNYNRSINATAVRLETCGHICLRWKIEGGFVDAITLPEPRHSTTKYVPIVTAVAVLIGLTILLIIVCYRSRRKLKGNSHPHHRKTDTYERTEVLEEETEDDIYDAIAFSDDPADSCKNKKKMSNTVRTAEGIGKEPGIDSRSTLMKPVLVTPGHDNKSYQNENTATEMNEETASNVYDETGDVDDPAYSYTDNNKMSNIGRRVLGNGSMAESTDHLEKQNQNVMPESSADTTSDTNVYDESGDVDELAYAYTDNNRMSNIGRRVLGSGSKAGNTKLVHKQVAFEHDSTLFMAPVDVSVNDTAKDNGTTKLFDEQQSQANGQGNEAQIEQNKGSDGNNVELTEKDVNLIHETEMVDNDVYGDNDGDDDDDK